MIASHLDAPSLLSYRMTSKAVCTWTKDNRKMNRAEWCTFTKKYETSLRRKKTGGCERLLSLGCSRCHHLLPLGSFSDEQVLKPFSRNRHCIICHMISGAQQDFTIHGVKFFACPGCLSPKALDEEELDLGAGTLLTGYRWCKGCVSIIQSPSLLHLLGKQQDT